MELKAHFEIFLSQIRPTDEQLTEYQQGHRTLRARFTSDATIKEIHVGDFLQGSYRRFTAIKPKAGKKSDVDIVVVTSLSEDETAEDIAGRFETFLDQFEDYKGNHSRKTHSIGISLDEVELDLVVTSAPDEVTEKLMEAESQLTRNVLNEDIRKFSSPERYPDFLLKEWTRGNGDWKLQPLRIPNFETGEWDSTDPLTQLTWTNDHNRACNGHYVNVVKALKWWRRAKCPTPKHPKGYPIEHIIGDYCSPGIDSVALGVVKTLEGIASCPTLAYYLARGERPFLADRGLPDHNVWHRVEPADFATFMEQVKAAAVLAHEAYHSQEKFDSVKGWYELFGDPFPAPDPEDKNRSSFFVPPTKAAQPVRERFG